ncbi:MAG TPA: tail fiber domain-containing protein [Vicinamibacterales bacterium]|nr:tail fiber domain-containing protein [Vicinamibacterales bacterium]
MAAGTGLTGGGSSGDVSLAVDFGSSGYASTVARSDHAHETGGVDAHNTAVGQSALAGNQTGVQNTAVGTVALGSNTTGMSNTASGMAALFLNTTGSENTGVGAGALTYSETGSQNTAVGFSALVGDPNNYNTGSRNTAIGVQALAANTSGEYNTASGYQALNLATSGAANIGIGFGAGPTLTTGNSNILIGSGAGVTLVSGNSNIYIGSGAGGANESNTMRLGASQGRTFISGIRGVTTGLGGAVAVVIDASGQLGTVSSSRRTKDHVEPLGAVSRAIFDLRPVQFTYKQAFAGGTMPIQYGLIAEEVELVMPELVAYNAAGEVETVQYHVLPTLLLAEVQRLERERTAMSDELAALRADRAAMAEALTELRAAVAALSRPRP